MSTIHTQAASQPVCGLGICFKLKNSCNEKQKEHDSGNYTKSTSLFHIYREIDEYEFIRVYMYVHSTRQCSEQKEEKWDSMYKQKCARHMHLLCICERWMSIECLSSVCSCPLVFTHSLSFSLSAARCSLFVIQTVVLVAVESNAS